MCVSTGVAVTARAGPGVAANRTLITDRIDTSGSVDLRADGNDLFPTTGPRAGLSCRLYRSGPTGGLPKLGCVKLSRTHRDGAA